MTKLKFLVPTMVKFYDKDNDTEMYGIAFRNEIICGCCGGILEIDETEILDDADWIDIQDAIKGGEEW